MRRIPLRTNEVFRPLSSLHRNNDATIRDPSQPKMNMPATISTSEKLLEKPRLTLDLDIATRNITRIASKFKTHGVAYRPHFKTHQSAAVGEVFKSLGVAAITVSSLDMAAYFAEHGWEDITLAVPINLGQVDAFAQLAKRITLHGLVDCVESAAALNDALQVKCPVWVKVDVGYGRVGVHWDNEQGVLNLVNWINAADHLSFKGLLTHSGHTYACRGRDEVVACFEEGRQRMLNLKQMLKQDGVDALVSMGDTPSASLADNFEGVDEMRPGNCVFYDLVQQQVGSCHVEDIAVATACPVIGKYKQDLKVVVYGGSVHLSKDAFHLDGQRLFGQLALPDQTGWSPVPLADAQVVSCCQEVSTIKVCQAIFDQIKLGQTVYILPAHSCLAAEVYPRYVTTTGQTLERFRLFT